MTDPMEAAVHYQTARLISYAADEASERTVRDVGTGRCTCGQVWPCPYRIRNPRDWTKPAEEADDLVSFLRGFLMDDVVSTEQVMEHLEITNAEIDAADDDRWFEVRIGSITVLDSGEEAGEP